MNDLTGKPSYKGENNHYLRLINQVLSEQPDLELAILIGSQTDNSADQNSDWDIAIRWTKQIIKMQRLGKTESLRRLLAKQLNLPETKIDLIDLTSVNLAMKAIVAEDGVILKGGDSLAWNYFLQRTWYELEKHYWDTIYAT